MVHGGIKVFGKSFRFLYSLFGVQVAGYFNYVCTNWPYIMFVFILEQHKKQAMLVCMNTYMSAIIHTRSIKLLDDIYLYCTQILLYLGIQPRLHQT